MDALFSQCKRSSNSCGVELELSNGVDGFLAQVHAPVDWDAMLPAPRLHSLGDVEAVIICATCGP